MSAPRTKPRQNPVAKPAPAAAPSLEMPRDDLAEKSLLGGLLIAPEAIDDVIAIIKPEDFYDDAHQRIYRKLRDLHDAGRKIDITILVRELTKSSELELVGGMKYLGELATTVPHAAHSVEYAKIVVDRAVAREAIHSAYMILRMAGDGEDGEQILGRLESSANALRERHTATDERIVHATDILHQAFEAMQERANGKPAGMTTGFVDLDKFYLWKPGQLIVLAARPAVGKSALALNFAEHVSRQGPVLFVSLEMTSLELGDRLLASVAHVDGKRMINGQLSNDERQQLLEAAGDISEHCNIAFDETPTRTVMQIAATARKWKRRNKGLAMVVVDYLQLIEPVATSERQSRQEQISGISRKLKIMARDLGCPVLVLSQLNRQIENRSNNRPRLSDLRESGAIEQDADVVMFVHREECFANNDEDRKRLEGQAEIIIEKQRGGEIGSVRCVWLKEQTRFASRAKASHHDEFNDWGPNA
jgi:replicative DNA helicase